MLSSRKRSKQNTSSLSYRMRQYEKEKSQILKNNQPVVIVIDVKNFKQSDYSNEFHDCMNTVSASLFNEIRDVKIGYTFGSQIILIINPNNKEIWCKGERDNMIGMISAIATGLYNELTDNFSVLSVKKLFNLPAKEISNYLLYKQNKSNQIYSENGDVLVKAMGLYHGQKMSKVEVLRKPVILLNKFDIIPNKNQIQNLFI